MKPSLKLLKKVQAHSISDNSAMNLFDGKNNKVYTQPFFIEIRISIELHLTHKKSLNCTVSQVVHGIDESCHRLGIHIGINSMPQIGYPFSFVSKFGSHLSNFCFKFFFGGVQSTGIQISLQANSRLITYFSSNCWVHCPVQAYDIITAI